MRNSLYIVMPNETSSHENLNILLLSCSSTQDFCCSLELWQNDMVYKFLLCMDSVHSKTECSVPSMEQRDITSPVKFQPTTLASHKNNDNSNTPMTLFDVELSQTLKIVFSFWYVITCTSIPVFTHHRIGTLL